MVHLSTMKLDGVYSGFFQGVKNKVLMIHHECSNSFIFNFLKAAILFFLSSFLFTKLIYYEMVSLGLTDIMDITRLFLKNRLDFKHYYYYLCIICESVLIFNQNTYFK